MGILLFPLWVMAAEVDMVADKITRDANGVITATGKVEIQHKDEIIRADKVRYDAAGKRIQAEGHVHIHSAKADIHAASGNISTTDKSGELLDVTVDLPDGEQLKAKRLLRLNDHAYQAFQPVVTTCPEDELAWRLYASEGLLDQNKGVFKANDATFEFAGVPVFYSPYWQHTLRRESGFLVPSFSVGKRRGTEWALPYYLAPQPDWDATITPHWMSARGLMMESELRHISTYGREQIQFEGLHDKVLNRSRSRLRGEGYWKLPLDMSLSIRGDEVSERDYVADFSHDSSQISRRYLSSHATLAQDFEYGQWSLASIYNHDISTANNKATLQQYPNFNLNMELPLFDSPATLHLIQNTTRFSDSNGANAIRDWRVYAHPYVTIPWDMPGGGASTTLTVGMTHTQYWLNQGAARKPSLSAGEVSLDSSMTFERINDAKTVRHSIIPRIRYDFNTVSNRPGVPNFDSALSPLRLSNLFSGNRYSGLDNVERSNRISFLLTNNIETRDAPDEPSRNVLSISGGAQYNMRSRFNALGTATSFSNLLGLMEFSPLANLTASVEGEYDPTRTYWNRVTETLTVNSADGDRLSASHVANNTELATISEAIEAAGTVVIRQRWKAKGSVNYDAVQKFIQQVTLGLTYTHPCWDIGLEAHRINRPTGTAGASDIGASLLIGFKGLGSVGSN